MLWALFEVGCDVATVAIYSAAVGLLASIYVDIGLRVHGIARDVRRLWALSGRQNDR